MIEIIDIIFKKYNIKAIIEVHHFFHHLSKKLKKNNKKIKFFLPSPYNAI